MTVRRLIIVFALVAIAASSASAAMYVRRGTARESYEASLAASGASVQLGPWHFIGPFDHADGKGFVAVYPPEEGVDLDAEHEGKDGRKLSWRRGNDFVDGRANSLRIFGDDNDWITVYIHRVITAPKAQELPVLLGSDDTLTLWLNGKRLIHHNTSRHCVLGDERLTLNLRGGENELLLKVCQGGGNSGFAFGLDEGGDSLLESIARDFPGEINDLLIELDWLRQARATGTGAVGAAMTPEDDAPGGCDGVIDG
ncbi:MAG TPA: hypothetical protein QGH10_13380, partial [Armatimonadota bacterium]|nr:hypothetical protein [Armatimonadota bacterium]